MSADGSLLERERFEVVELRRSEGGTVTVKLQAKRAVEGGGPYVITEESFEVIIRESEAPAIGNVYLVTVEPLRAGS